MTPRLQASRSNWPCRDAQAAEALGASHMLMLEQAVHVFQFIRWATNENA